MDLERIRSAAIKLMARDHVADVTRLDSLLAKGETATLSTEVPPNPYVGNPAAVTPNSCIAVMGINPALNMKRDGFIRNEIDTPLACKRQYEKTTEKSSFDPWLEKIHGYYQGDAYSKAYFAGLGGKIAAAWFAEQAGNDPEDATIRQILHNNVVKFDTIPYYSAKAGELAKDRVVYRLENDPALKCHLNCITTLVEETRPRLLLVNGKGIPGAVAREIFAVKDTMETLQPGASVRTRFDVGECRIGKHEMPMMIVRFLTGEWCPSMEHWIEIHLEFEKWLQTQS